MKSRRDKMGRKDSGGTMGGKKGRGNAKGSTGAMAVLCLFCGSWVHFREAVL